MKKIVLLLVALLFLSGCTSEKKILLINTDGNANADANIGLVDLNDGQTTYSGFAGKFLKVKASQDGWEWGDANGGSGSDTNCAVSGSCPNVLYKNTDFNAEDINAHTLTAQQPGGLLFRYGFSNKGLEIPFPTGCTETFGVFGFSQTGLEFCASPVVGLVARVLGQYNFIIYEGGTATGSVFMRPEPTLTDISGYPSFSKGAVVRFREDPDGNHIYELLGPAGWKQYHHSKYAPDFLFQTGDFNNTSDKNQLRFFGDVDFNMGIDVNRNGEFDGNVGTDSNFNLNRQFGKLNGWYLTPIALNGVSCDQACDQLDVNTGTNFTCTDAWQSTAGQPHVQCSLTTLNKNCLCKN